MYNIVLQHSYGSVVVVKVNRVVPYDGSDWGHMGQKDEVAVVFNYVPDFGSKVDFFSYVRFGIAE